MVFGTAEQAQSSFDLIKNQPQKSLALQRELVNNQLKTYNENLKIASESSSLLHMVPDHETTLPSISRMKHQSIDVDNSSQRVLTSLKKPFQTPAIHPFEQLNFRLESPMVADSIFGGLSIQSPVN